MLISKSMRTRKSIMRRSTKNPATQRKGPKRQKLKMKKIKNLNNKKRRKKIQTSMTGRV
jgi:hypothetical protein